MSMKTFLFTGIALAAAAAARPEAAPYHRSQQVATLPARGAPANANAPTNAPAIDEASAGTLLTPLKCGRVLVWDARTNATERLLRRFLKTNDPARLGAPGIAVTTERSPLSGDAFASAQARLKDPAAVTMVVMVVCGGQQMPRVSVFPEDRIGIVNADRFSPILLEKLLLREIWRTIGFTGGAGYAPYRGCVMQPVFSDQEVAGLMGDVIQPVTLQGFRKFETRFGMKRARYVPYEVACYEGWAPAPTNEAQRVIWKEVHALPSSPISIAPEAKKVKE